MPKHKIAVSKTKNKIKIEGEVPVSIIKEGAFFVAVCPIMDNLSSYGETWEEANRNFAEALMGTLLLLHSENKLEDFLLSSGWDLRTEDKTIHIIPPFVVSTQSTLPQTYLEKTITLQNAQTEAH